MRPLMHNKTHSKERLIGLDLLRGLAVLLVLGHHLPALAIPEDWPALIKVCLDAWRRGGWVGVDVFFVLSGFLVSGLLFDEYQAKGTMSVSRFYVRRGWKIYPPFFFFISVTILSHLSMRQTVDSGALTSECLFLQSYVPGLWNHTWSLAVEEHFYIVLPILLGCMLTLRKQPNPFAWMLPITVALCACTILVLRLENYSRMPWFNHHTHLAPTHLRIDSLLFGVLIAYVYHFHQAPFVRALRPYRGFLVVAGIGLLALPFIYSREVHPFTYTVGPTLYYIGAGALTVSMLLTSMPRRGFLVPLSRIGVYSYSIYLWHMPVMRWGAPKLEAELGTSFSVPVLLLLHVGGSVIFGIMMAKIIETPALWLRDRWFPSASNTQLTQPPSTSDVIAAPSLQESSSTAELSRS